ncbi:hypothetical protein AB0B56_10525 [Streptosporangium canum]
MTGNRTTDPALTRPYGTRPHSAKNVAAPRNPAHCNAHEVTSS